jgi:hypothetical protein
MTHDGLQALPITDSISARKCIAKKRFTTVSKTLFNKLLKAIHITSINPYPSVFRPLGKISDGLHVRKLNIAALCRVP